MRYHTISDCIATQYKTQYQIQTPTIQTPTIQTPNRTIVASGVASGQKMKLQRAAFFNLTVGILHAHTMLPPFFLFAFALFFLPELLILLLEGIAHEAFQYTITTDEDGYTQVFRRGILQPADCWVYHIHNIHSLRFVTRPLIVAILITRLYTSLVGA